MGARYREIEIRTATPEMLVVKMYEGATRFIRGAMAAGGSGDLQRRAESISRALAIVMELQQSLNMEAGGEMARNLDALYTFVTERLVDANLEKRSAPLEDCLGVLERLQEAWVEIAKSAPERTQPGGGAVTGASG